MNKDVLFSSASCDWSTPQSFYDDLNLEFNFNLDPCADDFNHKCDRYFTVRDNGLIQSWSGSRVFCNPPYGRKVGDWVKKAFDEVRYGSCPLVVMLLPARTDTSWFHDFILGHSEIRFLRGRLKFGGSKNSAPFPCMVVVFEKSYIY